MSKVDQKLGTSKPVKPAPSSPTSTKTSDSSPVKRQTAGPRRPTTPASSDAKPKPPREGLVEVLYDPNTSSYYARNARGNYQRWQKDELNLLLRRNGYFVSYKHEDGLTWLEAERLRITQEHSVDFAGSLGGYQPGVHTILTSKVLVTNGPVFLAPKEGKWEALKEFLSAILGDQARYFAAWLKVAVTSLRKGYPWAQGQLIAFAGPPGVGKSVLQGLITPLLGGRVSSPWRYLSGKTEFNGHIYAAEHGSIGDVNHEVSQRARRSFAAAIKSMVAEHVHDVHPKGRPAITLTPFLRLSLTLNDEQNSLHVLPPLDSDIAGKIMLLRTLPVDFAKLMRKYGDVHAYNLQLISELPAMLHYLRRWPIPPSIADQRYGVMSFKDAELVSKVQAISGEEQLLDTLDTYLFDKSAADHWQGNATELLKALAAKMTPTLLSQICRDAAHLGGLLSVLCKSHPERITMHTHGAKRKTYLILQEPLGPELYLFKPTKLKNTTTPPT